MEVQHPCEYPKAPCNDPNTIPVMHSHTDDDGKTTQQLIGYMCKPHSLELALGAGKTVTP